MRVCISYVKLVLEHEEFSSFCVCSFKLSYIMLLLKRENNTPYFVKSTNVDIIQTIRSFCADFHEQIAL